LKEVLSSKENISNKNAIDDIDIAYNRVKNFLIRQGSPRILGKKEEFILSYEKNENLQRVVIDINEVEEKIEKATSSRFELQELLCKLFSANKHIEFTNEEIKVTSLDKQNIGLEYLSAGEKQILQIFIETLLTNDDSILIDEPELSMHIDWQKELLSDMRLLNPNAQIIVATHSPEIMADMEDSRIFKL
jgi:predicted ATP-dependent endonuclease of OLD family